MNPHTFPRTAPAPDPAALVTAVRAVIGDPFTVEPISIEGVLTITIAKPTVWTAADLTAVQGAITACVASTPARTQQSEIDNLSVREKAICLTLLDQINTIRNLLPVPLPPITVPQALSAIRTKAGTL